MPKSFPPLISANTQILIIGSMPGQASLRAQEYYAYAHNQFWRIIFDVFEAGRTPKNYTDKQKVIFKHRLGLWDSLATCERMGSLDSQIIHPIANDFPSLFRHYPKIRKLLFNGNAAFKFYKQAFGIPSHAYCILPSTSPAHATRSYAEKKVLWQAQLQDPPTL